jgi:hypothetical protein
MPTLTDSFCERCGTRYVFSEPAPKRPSIKNARVFAKGLKNFVLTDGQTITEAIALARNDDDHEDSTRMTEAFHRTFNFCMTCRQYACDKCWNEKQGACLSCSPDSDLLPIAPDDRLIIRTPVAHNEAELARLAAPDPARNSPQLDRPSWPEADLVVAPVARPGAFPGGIGARKPAVIADQGDPMAWASVVESQAQSEPLDIMSWGKPRVSGETVPGSAESTAPATPVEPASPIAPIAPAPSKRRAKADWSLWPVSEAQERAGGAGTNTPDASADQSPADRPEAAPIAEAAPFVAEAAPLVAEAAPIAEPAAIAGPAPIAEAAPAFEVAPAIAEPAADQIVELRGSSTPATQVAATAAVDAEGAEMALTPSELMLVEAELGHTEPAPPEPASLEAGSSPAPDSAAATSWTPAHTLAEDAALPLPRPTLLHNRRQPEARPAAGWEPESAQTSRPASQEPRHTPAAARLFGREAEVTAPVNLPGSQPATDPWPRPTPWSDRPVKAYDWFCQPTPASMPSPALADWPVETVQSQPVPAMPEVSLAAQAPSLEAASLPQSPIEALDLRAAALAQARPEPAHDDTMPLFNVASRTTPAAGPAGEDRATNQWPPLGASFPNQPRIGAWAGPEESGVPAVIAAQAAEPDMASMWAQSAQEVMNRGSVRVCHKCALPVSTHARFCRRCGTEQG